LALDLNVVDGMHGLVAAASLARMVVGGGSTPPTMQPDAVVLFVHRLAAACPMVDAGVDAGVADAGVADAGVRDAGVPDAGVPPAPCGSSVMMVIQPRFGLGTGGSKFALLMVTPGDPEIRLESPSIFADLDRVTAPIEHDVEVDVEDPALGTRCPSYGGGGGGCGGGGWSSPGPTWTAPGLDGGFGSGSTSFATIGPYDVASSHPPSQAELSSWLDGLGYVYQASDLDAIDPYLVLGWYVIAIEVDSLDPIDGGLDPLSLTWTGSEIRVPLGLGRQAKADPTNLRVYIADAHRLDVPGAHVSFAGELAMVGASFVTRNDVSYDATKGADADPIAVAVAGDPATHDEFTVQHEVHVPVTTSCSPQYDDDGGCCDSARGGGNGVLYAAAVAIALRRRRLRRDL
jgi:hypothetical protein